MQISIYTKNGSLLQNITTDTPVKISGDLLDKSCGLLKIKSLVPVKEVTSVWTPALSAMPQMKLPWVTQKILWLRDCKSLLLDKETSPPSWAAICSLYAVWVSIFLFIKLRQQHIHMGSGKIIKECLL